MDNTDAGAGKVVVNRAMSLDGFIAGPEDEMDWVLEQLTPNAFPQDRGGHRRHARRPPNA